MKAVQRQQPKYWAVVPAAGIGERMGVDIPKQYLEIMGKTLLEHTLERLVNFQLLEKIVLVLRKGDIHASNLTIIKHKKIVLAEGGNERYHSVMNGLKVVAEWGHDDDWVLIHDAVRPCIRQADLEWLVECVRGHEVGGLLGAIIKDTIKRTNPSDCVVETVDRSLLWHAFTPQMFKLELLIEALTKVIVDNIPITDEAAAMECLGHKPLMVEGHFDNIKVTSSVDLALASLYIEQQSKLIENT